MRISIFKPGIERDIFPGDLISSISAALPVFQMEKDNFLEVKLKVEKRR